MNPRYRWLPTIGLSLWLVFVLGLTLSPWRLVMINADGDTCLHRQIGNWMIQHRAIMRADPFSHTHASAPIVTMEWLSELAFAIAGNALGWNGVTLLSAMMIAASLWILQRQMLSEGSDVIVATALALLAGDACSMHWLARPHVVSFVFLAWFGWQLHAFERGAISPRQLLVRLIPLTVLWVNLHAGFLTGLMLIGVCFAGAAVGLFVDADEHRAAARRNMQTLALAGFGCCLASLANPNGWGLYRYLGNFFQHSSLVGFISEFRSPSFHSPSTNGFTLLLAALALTLIVARPRLRPTELLLIGWSGFLALRWVRNIPLFAIVVTPIMGRHLSAALPELRGRWAERYRRICDDLGRLNRAADGRWLAGVALVALVVAFAKPHLVGGAPLVETDLLTNRFPVAAVNFVRQNPGAVSREMFNDYGWGGYLDLALPEHKVFVDGRNDFFGLAVIQDFDDVNKVRPDWDAVLRKHQVGWTILPQAHPLNALLSLETNWTLAYADDVAVIYTRKLE
ncbi:MAG TPA: hypothetical protein VMV72_11430 [Verrucomicrobiae bacterium]|nr:hypothetical protein [Verrucomicrobiae bacterium]